MIIDIPEYMYESFIIFLDIAQSNFTEEDIEKFTNIEKETYNFIKGLIKNPSRIYKSDKEKREAIRKFYNLFTQGV